MDDDLTTLLLVGKIFESGGYQVVTHNSPTEAWAHYRDQAWTAVVLDYHMPELDGAQLLQKIRSIDKQTPVLFLTSNDQLSLAVEMTRKGADDYMVKPPVAEALLLRMDRVIDARENERRIEQIRQEQALLELENKKLIRWREMYGTKDVAQTRQMIQLLSRNINQSGGFLWLDLLRSEMERPAEGDNHLVSSMVLEMAVTAAEGQKQILEYVTYIAELDTMELDLQSVPAAEIHCTLAALIAELLTEVGRDSREITSGCTDDLQPPAREMVCVDTVLLGHIMEELLINAIKFSPEGSRILYSSEVIPARLGRVLELTVRNNAGEARARDNEGKPIVGIPYDYAELVFDLFYAIESFPVEIPRERWRYGTGLYICRRLLQRMGGTVTARTILDHSGSDSAGPTPQVELKVRLPLQ